MTKEERKEYNRKWREAHKGCDKKYYKNNREKKLAASKKWREEHPGYDKEWKQKHENYDKEYYKKNREKRIESVKKSKKKMNDKSLEQTNKYRVKWTTEEAAYLLENANRPLIDVANELGRSLSGVESKLHNLRKLNN